MKSSSIRLPYRLLPFLSLLCVSIPAAASDCIDAYRLRIEALDALLSPARWTTLHSGATSGVTVSALGAAGALSGVAAISAGGAVLAPAAIWAMLSLERRGFENALQLHQDSLDGHGPALRKFTRKMRRRMRAEVDADTIRQEILDGFSSGRFCRPSAGSRKTRPLPFGRILRIVQRDADALD